MPSKAVDNQSHSQLFSVSSSKTVVYSIILDGMKLDAKLSDDIVVFLFKYV